MKLFFSYIKIHIKSLLLFSANAAVFAIVFYLYKLPLEPVLYSATLCLFFGSVLFFAGFVKFIRRHNILRNLENSILLTLDNLPEPKTQIERDYMELIELLFREKCRVESDKAIAINSTTQYYTLWAHQIKTPIAAMQLLLQSGDTDSTQLEEQLFRIEEYVQMVLTYQRCEQVDSDYVFKQHDLDSIVRSCVKKYAKLFIRRKINLNYTGVNMRVMTDEKWLSFVIEQLLSNALKYTPQGSITVSSDSGSYLVISDTGIGIAPEDLPRVCERGYTGYNGRADKKSTGIGLYLCKSVLDRLGHSLEILSDLNSGTIVRIGFDTIDRRYE